MDVLFCGMYLHLTYTFVFTRAGDDSASSGPDKEEDAAYSGLFPNIRLSPVIFYKS